jgi:WhiB family redox-sensing transcriptional regulator
MRKGRPDARLARVRRTLDELGFTARRVEGWRELAECAGSDPELFYPEGAGPAVRAQVDTAKRICAGCPVRELCLAEVMGSEDPGLRWGVAGGLSASERSQVFAARRVQLGEVA